MMPIIGLINPIHALPSYFLTVRFNNIPYIIEGLASVLHSGFLQNTLCAFHFSPYLLYGSVYTYFLNGFTRVT